MVIGSTFSGVGGLDLGLERAGHAVAFQVEADPYRRDVLARHWPAVPRHDDVCTFDGTEWHGRIDLLCGGFPCQDLSTAGQRAGLAGAKSGLFFEFARIASEAVRPDGWILVENVGGLLTSHNGRDFAIVLTTLAEIGFYDLSWRILDSQYCGVPQRRRRVFLIGRRARGRCAATVLLEPEGGGGNFEARSKAGSRTSHRTQSGIARTRTGSGKRYDADTDDFVIAPTLKSNGSHGIGGAGGRNDQHPIVAVPKPDDYWIEDFRNGTLTADPGRSDRKPIILAERHNGAAPDADRVRTATGLPRRMDGSPVIDPKPDGRRYAAVGDAVTVNVAAWIGWRLADFERGRL